MSQVWQNGQEGKGNVIYDHTWAEKGRSITCKENMDRHGSAIWNQEPQLETNHSTSHPQQYHLRLQETRQLHQTRCSRIPIQFWICPILAYIHVNTQQSILISDRPYQMYSVEVWIRNAWITQKEQEAPGGLWTRFTWILMWNGPITTSFNFWPTLDLVRSIRDGIRPKWRRSGNAYFQTN